MKKYPILLVAGLLLFNTSCQEKDDGPDPAVFTITIDPSITYQEMTGFGGSLTWYSSWVTASPYKNQICKLLFEDLGTDMIRLKNWYYPSGYPTNKSTDVMETSGMKTLFETTNELYTIAKQYNSHILTLLSSWGPPPALKSNNNLNQGTLKKDGGAFMYQAFADYWTDILDHISFNPDYISIQNEPTYVNAGWETCEWRPTETADFPGYVTAFDLVYNNISTREDPPLMIGPESANIGTATYGGNTFSTFAETLKDKPHLAMYGFHTYNFSASTYISDTKTSLNMIRDSYGNKPCIMTEYSGMSWLKTAQFIIQVVNEANASGYLYWDMVWADDDDKAMIKVNYNGAAYSLTPCFYMMKHFSRNIDPGYTRINAEMISLGVTMSAFLNPAGDQITIVLVNPLTTAVNIKLSMASKTITGINGVQTQETSLYKDMGTIALVEPIKLKQSSITTLVLDIE